MAANCSKACDFLQSCYCISSPADGSLVPFFSRRRAEQRLSSTCFWSDNSTREQLCLHLQRGLLPDKLHSWEKSYNKAEIAVSLTDNKMGKKRRSEDSADHNAPLKKATFPEFNGTVFKSMLKDPTQAMKGQSHHICTTFF